MALTSTNADKILVKLREDARLNVEELKQLLRDERCHHSNLQAANLTDRETIPLPDEQVRKSAKLFGHLAVRLYNPDTATPKSGEQVIIYLDDTRWTTAHFEEGSYVTWREIYRPEAVMWWVRMPEVRGIDKQLSPRPTSADE